MKSPNDDYGFYAPPPGGWELPALIIAAFFILIVIGIAAILWRFAF